MERERRVALSIPFRFLGAVAQDSRHALRLWANRPWHTAFAILALAIGIGANTGVFSVVNALLLRSLPFRDPGQLASLVDFDAFVPPHDSARQFHEWRQRSTFLADVALLEERDDNVGVSRLMRAHISQTSWNFFSLLGVQPVLGRTFAPGEDDRGRNDIAVIGYGLWQELFAGDPRVLGSVIRFAGHPLTIVGVAPPGFSYPHDAVLWKPANFSTGNNGWDAIARLKPGVTWSQARAAFAAEVARLTPPHLKFDNLPHPPAVTPLQDQLAGPVRNASLMLMAGVALILLIACTNVANLLMARTADRAAELSVRSALGASRARLAQQLLTECLLLSLVAATAGTLVAVWTTSIAAKVQPAALATQAYSILDSRVLAFAVAVSIVSGLVFGLLPAMFAGRVPPSGFRGSTAASTSRLTRESLVAVQVMLTIVLLTASFSIGRAFLHIMGIDRGFTTSGLITVSVALDGTTHGVNGRQLSYFQETLSRIRRLPGVRSASATEFLPLYATDFVGGPFSLDGRPPQANSMAVPVMPDYFRTMGAKLLCGRDFIDADLRDDAEVAIVSESFAAQFGTASDALSHRLTNGDDPPRKIIGVVKGMDYMTPGANHTQVFLPSRDPGGFFSTVVVRVSGRAEDHLAEVRDVMRSVDPQVPVFGVKTMQQRLEETLRRPSFYRTAVLFFAGFAQLLVVIGIYGVVSYAVSRRMHEMGVRLALGTTPARVRGMLLRQGLLPVVAGSILGIAGAALTSRYLESLVEGAGSVGLATFLFSVLFIAAIAATSIWAATRRIAALDIMDILRTE